MVEAQKLNLPYLSVSSPQVTSLFHDPISQSLAVMHSDSTFSLFPSFSLSSLPPPQTLIPAPSSSASFLTLNPSPKTPNSPRVVFVTAGPHEGGSRVCLRFWVLGKDGKFGKAQVVCSQNGICFDRKLGVIVDVSHGMRVTLTGSVNYLAMYSPSAGKMWVFGVRLVGEGSDLRLVKCAVIDCHLPVLSISVSGWFLVLGELHGVRVFPLRALVKGRVDSSIRRRVHVVRGRIENLNREKYGVNVSLEGRKSKLPNGAISSIGEGYEVDKIFGDVNISKSVDNGRGGNVNGVSSNSVIDGNHDAVKLRSLKLRQDSGEVGMQFILFNDSIEGVRSVVPGYKTKKAISIQPFSHQKFLILDSNGDVYVLHTPKSGSFFMTRLTGIIQVQKLAAFPDTQNVWVSDGFSSLQKLVIPNTTENENENSSIREEIIQSSVTEVIFTNEKIQDMIPLAANSILILGQGDVYVCGQSIFKFFE